MTLCVQWHPIIDTCKFSSGHLWPFFYRRLLWSPALCVISQFFGKRGEKTTNFHLCLTVHCAIYTRDLTSVHTWCPLELVSHETSIPLFSLLLFAAKGTQNTFTPLFPPQPPFHNLVSLQAANTPGYCWENFAKRKKQLLKSARNELYRRVKQRTGVMHTSSLRATATPNRDWIHSGIGRFWVSGTKPNKREFLLMQ